MITIIYPYRNRDLLRIKNSLDSLAAQSVKNFKVLFVDYGSDLVKHRQVEEMLVNYKFVNYIYSYSIHQPWSRSKAINIGIRKVETDYVFIADIDIIFHFKFIEFLYQIKNPVTSFYFQVGYLDKYESQELKSFDDYKITLTSSSQAQGLSLIPYQILMELNGFDEFFHYWGAEDEDLHNRIINANYTSKFYEKEIFLLHQWHPEFKKSDGNVLTTDLRLSNIYNLNLHKLIFNRDNKLVKVNSDKWGNLLTEENYRLLESHIESELILNKVEHIDNFFNITLPNTHNKIINVKFKIDDYEKSIYYKIKLFLKISTKRYYTIKIINDLILTNIIVHYKEFQYILKVSDDLKSILLKIKK
jgi:hypothetical protein